MADSSVQREMIGIRVGDVKQWYHELEPKMVQLRFSALVLGTEGLCASASFVLTHDSKVKGRMSWGSSSGRKGYSP